jgi:AbrB family looped-hinge helix DNA binding protein
MIMPVSKMVRNGQLTIPAKIRKTLHIQDGDLVRFDVHNNQLIVTPVSIIDKDQAYFFSEKWQKAVKTSEKAVREGKYASYSSAKDLKKDIGND